MLTLICFILGLNVGKNKLWLLVINVFNCVFFYFWAFICVWSLLYKFLYCFPLHRHSCYTTTCFAMLSTMTTSLSRMFILIIFMFSHLTGKCFRRGSVYSFWCQTRDGGEGKNSLSWQLWCYCTNSWWCEGTLSSSTYVWIGNCKAREKIPGSFVATYAF